MNAMFVLVLAIITPMVVLVGIVSIWRKFQSRDKRRSPLTSKIHNLPGEQLRTRISDLNDNLSESLFIFIFMAPILMLVLLLSRVNLDTFNFKFIDGFALFVYLTVAIYYLIKIIKAIDARRRAKEGLAAEVITGQYLLSLLGQGCLIFHDVPAKNDIHKNDKPFNLDHVVIGPYGVFMVETKSRKKPMGGKDSAKVDFDGKVLKFPTHFESKPIDQAKSQAKWLSEYLSSNLGESIAVIPVLALPGWYVQNSISPIKSEVKVINPKNLNIFVQDKIGPMFSDIQKNRIANALAIRYPALDV